MFGGLLAATLFGAFTTVAFGTVGDAYVLDLVAASPGRYVLPVLLIGLIGSMGQGALNMYATGLDLESLIPGLRRVQTTLITSLTAVAAAWAAGSAVGLLSVNTTRCTRARSPRSPAAST